MSSTALKFHAPALSLPDDYTPANFSGDEHPNISPFAKVSAIATSGQVGHGLYASQVRWADVRAYKVTEATDPVSQTIAHAASMGAEPKILWPNDLDARQALLRGHLDAKGLPPGVADTLAGLLKALPARPDSPKAAGSKFQQGLRTEVGSNLQAARLKIRKSDPLSGKQHAVAEQGGHVRLLAQTRAQAKFFAALPARYAAVQGRFAALVDWVNSEEFDESIKANVKALVQRLRALRKRIEA